MRKILYKKFLKNERGLIVGTTEMNNIGVFLGLGFDYEEFEGGPGNYSTCVIEEKDGSVLNVPVEMTKFIEPTLKNK